MLWILCGAHAAQAAQPVKKPTGVGRKTVRWKVSCGDNGSIDAEKKVAVHVVGGRQRVPQDREFARVCSLLYRSTNALSQFSPITRLTLSLKLDGDQVALQASQKENRGNKIKRVSDIDVLLSGLKQVLEGSEHEDVMLAQVDLLTATYLLRRRKSNLGCKKAQSSVASGAGGSLGDLTEDYFISKSKE